MLDYTGLTFPQPPRTRPYVILNMILSADGRTALQGSRAIRGSTTDRRLMHELRGHADAVLVGGETFRSVAVTPRSGPADTPAGPFRAPMRANPLAVVLSAAGRLPLDRPFFTAADFEGIVYLADDCPADRRSAVEAGGRPIVSVPVADAVPFVLRDLHKRLGVRRLLLESGPRLNAAFHEEDAIDELFLTIAPVVDGGSAPPLVAPGSRSVPAAPFNLLSCEFERATGEVFLRYRRSR
ncbi:MAG: RibD family protein [Dehalococcoidia bacterium]